MENFITWWRIVMISIAVLAIIVNWILNRQLRHARAKLWLLRKIINEKPAQTIYPDEIVNNMPLKAIQETVSDLMDYYREAATKWDAFVLGRYLMNIDNLPQKKEKKLFEIIFGQAILSLSPNRLAAIVINSMVEDINQIMKGMESVHKKRAEDFILRMMLIEGKEGKIALNFLQEFDGVINRNIDSEEKNIIELAGKFRKNFE